MTGAAHESAKICHSNNLANLQGDARSVRRHYADLNLYLDTRDEQEQQRVGF